MKFRNFYWDRSSDRLMPTVQDIVIYTDPGNMMKVIYHDRFRDIISPILTVDLNRVDALTQDDLIPILKSVDDKIEEFYDVYLKDLLSSYKGNKDGVQ